MKRITSAMIIKTIAADRQLAEGHREQSLTNKTATLKPIEKSYLRSQFERRQKRQIGLTNKMHRNRPSCEESQPERSPRRQHEQQQDKLVRAEEQPDSAVRSHELIKRRFFEELERRESINSARVAATHGQAKLHQQQQQHAAAAGPTDQVAPTAHSAHHNQQQPTTGLSSDDEQSDWAERNSGSVKADINEPDGAGTDADEASSLETIITNNPKSSSIVAAPAIAIAGSGLYERPAGASSQSPALPPCPSSDNSVGPPARWRQQQQQQVESGEGTSDDHDDVGASTGFTTELALVEQQQKTGQFFVQAQGCARPRHPSKAAPADLQAGLQQAGGEACEQAHEIMLHRSISLKQQKPAKEQYANARSVEDSARGSQSSGDSSFGNNVNHDQYDGCCEHEMTLEGFAVGSQVQESAHLGMQLDECDEGGKLVRREGINPLERGCGGGGGVSPTGGHGLVGPSEQQQQQQVLLAILKPEDSSRPQDQLQIVQEASRTMTTTMGAMACSDTELSETGRRHAAGRSGAPSLDSAPPASAIDRGSAQEEDARSSCSSSGFGASVSASSSAASSSSEGRRGHGGGHHRNRHHLHLDRCSQAAEAVNGAEGAAQLCGAQATAGVGLSADEIAQFEIVVGRLDSSNALEQTLSVGVGRNREDDDDDDDGDDDAHCKMVHVENHGYGSVEDSGNGSRASGAARIINTTTAATTTTTTRTTRNQTDKRRWPLVNPDDLSNELDLLSRQYVNLPAAVDDRQLDSCERRPPYSMEAAASVGYATVRAARPKQAAAAAANPARGQTFDDGCNVGLANSALRRPAEPNNGGNPAGRNGPDGALIKLNGGGLQRDGAEDCGSEHNSSTSSSGGFSQLPPVRLIDHNFANNFQSATGTTIAGKAQAKAASRCMEESNSSSRDGSAATQSTGRKSASLLKRFGSLVSRAFTSGNLSNGGELANSANNLNRGQNGAAQLFGGGTDSSNRPRRRRLSGEIPSFVGLSHSNDAGLNSSDAGQIPGLREHKSTDMASERERAQTSQRGHQDQDSNRSQGQASAPMAAAYSQKSLAVAEADLVILSEKHSRDHQQATRTKRPVTMSGGAEIHHHHHQQQQQQRYGSRSGRHVDESPLEGGARRAQEKLATTKERFRSSKLTRHHTNPKPKKTFHELIERFDSARRSTTPSSASCSSFTSLDDLSSTSSPIQDSKTTTGASAARRQRTRARSKLERASSLSDELESLISPSEVGSSQQNCAVDELDFGLGGKCYSAASRFDADHDDKPCLSGGGGESVRSRAHRFRMRWFSVNGSTGGGCSSQNDESTGSFQCEPQSWASSSGRRTLRESSRRKFESLIDHNHASGRNSSASNYKLDTSRAGGCNRKAAAAASNLDANLEQRLKSELPGGREHLASLERSRQQQQQQPTSLIYTSLTEGRSLYSLDKELKRQHVGQLSLRPDGGTRDAIDRGGGDLAGAKLRREELLVNDNGKCQSLNLYQNLLRNYVKRRSHNHHHHHHRHHRHQHRGHNHDHHHHHHHNHHRHASGQHRSSSSRHAHCSSSTTRCGQRCSSPSCESSNNLQQPTTVATRASLATGRSHGAANQQTGVWGQLIKIKKSDGSQVIELQRAPDRSWGFFVARGAINNTKGIFISRMHSSSTGNSLSGLLSVGDRILSIDNYAIEPDFDILRVNQMISKKSKIHLEVKPFKG